MLEYFYFWTLSFKFLSTLWLRVSCFWNRVLYSVWRFIIFETLNGVLYFQKCYVPEFSFKLNIWNYWRPPHGAPLVTLVPVEFKKQYAKMVKTRREYPHLITSEGTYLSTTLTWPQTRGSNSLVQCGRAPHLQINDKFQRNFFLLTKKVTLSHALMTFFIFILGFISTFWYEMEF